MMISSKNQLVVVSNNAEIFFHYFKVIIIGYSSLLTNHSSLVIPNS